MEKKKNNNEISLKEAKKAVWLNRWFGKSIPFKFECMIVNLDCCSEEFLVQYIEKNVLTPEAEKLLIEKYYASKPSLIALYLVPSFNICTDMVIDLIKRKDTVIFKQLAENSKKHEATTSFHIKSKIFSELINLNDADYFSKFLKLSLGRIYFCDEHVNQIIKLENPHMFDVFLDIFKQKKELIKTFQQQLLLKQNNNEMISCYLKHYSFDNSCLFEIFEQHNLSLLREIVQTERDWEENIQETFVKNCTLEELQVYLSKFFLCERAQIALIKRDDKSLIKLYESARGFSDHAIIYYSCLKHFKEDFKIA